MIEDLFLNKYGPMKRSSFGYSFHRLKYGTQPWLKKKYTINMIFEKFECNIFYWYYLNDTQYTDL